MCYVGGDEWRALDIQRKEAMISLYPVVMYRNPPWIQELSCDFPVSLGAANAK